MKPILQHGSKNPGNRRGVALVIAIGLLALVSAMFLGYSASMRSYRNESRSVTDFVQANFLARSAVDRAMATLLANTPIRSSTNTWYSGPGFIVRNAGAAANIASGGAQAMSATGYPNGLNLTEGGGQAFSIVPDTSLAAPPGKRYDRAMLDTQFILVGRDGSTPSATNPLVGRITWWADDEASKINWNYAHQLDTTKPLSVRQIDLFELCQNGACAAYTAGDLNTACAARYPSGCTGGHPTTAGLLNSPEKPFETLQAVQAVTNFDNDYKLNRFFTTVYSWDDNRTFAGQLRRDITALTKTADIDVATGATSLRGLMNDAAVSPWGNIFTTTQVATTKDTFEEKYGAASVKQILANIIDYQAADTANATYNGLDATSVFGVARNTPNDGGWLGWKKTPMINEILLNARYTTSGTNLTVELQVSVELVNPFPTALASGYLLSAHLASAPTFTVTAGGGSITTAPTFNAKVTQSVSTAVPANSYGVYNIIFTQTNTATFTGSITGLNVNIALDNVRLLASTTDTPTAIRDYSGFPVQTFGTVTVAANNGATYNAANAISFQRNDPRVRWHAGPSAAGAGTPGVRNASVITGYNTSLAGTTLVPSSPSPPFSLLADFVSTSATFDPKDLVGASIDVSNHWNPVAPGGAAVPMASIGELGRIHTGYQWRTLRLQPRPTSGGESDAIPDWAILDLVRIPTLETDQSVAAYPKVHGRININQRIASSVVTTGAVPGGAVPSPFRQVPLLALFGPSTAGNWFSSTANRDTAVANVYNYTGTLGGSGFDTIGEICQVAGLEDGATNDAAAEKLIRAIANNITVRSNTFTIWAYAEIIKDVNKNQTFEPATDQITGAQFLKAVVERVEVPSATPTNVRYRVKYISYPDFGGASGVGGCEKNLGDTGCTTGSTPPNCCNAGACTSSKCCIANSAAGCSVAAHCCTAPNCTSGVCCASTTGTKLGGAACSTAAECCSNTCTRGSCASY